MRRADREVTDPGKIQDIIGACNCCRLGISDPGGVYIVPMSFGYENRSGVHTFYFHSATEGRKIDLLHRNPVVGFELDTHYQLKTAVSPCGYSSKFQSVIGTGRVVFLESPDEKYRALSMLMRHYTGTSDWKFSTENLKNVCVFRLSADTLSCKEHS